MAALGSHISFGDDTDDDDTGGSWKSSVAVIGTLFVFSYYSATFFGLGYPLTVVLLTLLGETLTILLVGALIITFFRQSIGNFTPKRWKDMDR